MAEHGQQEGDGFSRTSLGNTNDITAGHDCGYSLSLDGGRRCIVQPFDDTQTIRVKLSVYGLEIKLSDIPISWHSKMTPFCDWTRTIDTTNFDTI